MHPNSSAINISNYLSNQLKTHGVDVEIFHLADAQIPFFNMAINSEEAANMNNLFREADVHIWLTPLYHGGMTGIMKNCLDWLELSAKKERPYLTNKVVGMICWSAGGHAMQGINAMESVAKALRAWTLPYSVPVMRNHLYEPGSAVFTKEYQQKFNLLIQLLLEAKQTLK
ncbi:arsenic resistance protein ArsH [Chitinophaga skermanii]|uniref:Arsenic resistance protein ArsH n=2 Tax=Chitinophaga skermanii TaxID=331697 RepID=A0A327QEI3_9BACT|nr:arsenic resistance protein ArsH [Chitinophaga skermanii]